MNEESWERQWIREAVAAPPTLTDFLLARIAEVEEVCDPLLRETQTEDWFAERMLAECEAKRRIVEAATDYSPELEHGDNGEWAFDVALRMLALPYADHPDYREEWRP